MAARALSGASIHVLIDMVANGNPEDLTDAKHELGFRNTRKAHRLAASIGCDVASGTPSKHIKARKGSAPASAALAVA